MMKPTPEIGAKGNTGFSAKKRKQKKIFLYGIGILSVYVTAMTIYNAHFAGMFVEDVELDPETGRHKIRRRPGRQKKRLDPEKKTTQEDAVLEGYLTLVDLYVPSNGLQGTSEGYTVQATFCNIDWKLQQRDPSTVAMFRDLRDQSMMCDGTLTTVDLFDMTKQVKAYDAKINSNSTLKTQKDVSISTPPTGVIFHETRCGSTLASNLLASFSPAHTRSYSESPPPLKALEACSVNPCNPRLHTQLIRDVFYIMGRTIRKERPQYVFYKIQSIGTMNIDKFTEAFPDTPWVFFYRDSVEVMQSHMKGLGSVWSLSDRTPVCARNFEKSYQPQTTQKIIQTKDKEEISKMDYCAAHLAGLSLAAIEEHERSGKGRFVNYNQLPDKLWDTIMPRDFGIPVNEEMISNMRGIAGVYSKGKGKKAGQSWVDDSTKKLSSATDGVVQTANFWMKDTYEKMEGLSHMD